MEGLPAVRLQALQEAFGARVRRDEPLARYTSARVGGPADVLIVADSATILQRAASMLWTWQVSFRVLGGGSNVLVADAGIRGVVILNQAQAVRFWEGDHGPRVRAESGAALGAVARRAVKRAWSGLEWAAAVPGTVGGAVVGNAGAFGGDVAGSLEVAEILQPHSEVETWAPERLEFGYRESWLKRHPGQALVVAATFKLQPSTAEQTEAQMRTFVEQRKATQPSGASMGSMFKNPSGDHAGRLIEAAGLKGATCGKAQISPVHANFFVNLGGASAVDVWELIRRARQAVADAFGVDLELEVELLGEWNDGRGEGHG